MLKIANDNLACEIFLYVSASSTEFRELIVELY